MKLEAFLPGISMTIETLKHKAQEKDNLHDRMMKKLQTSLRLSTKEHIDDTNSSNVIKMMQFPRKDMLNMFQCIKKTKFLHLLLSNLR